MCVCLVYGTVAARVAARSHEVNNLLLKVYLSSGDDVQTLSRSSDFEPNKAIVLNVTQQTPAEMLKLFVLAKTGVEVASIEMCLENARALITLEGSYGEAL